MDTRCIVQYDDECFAVCVWGDAKIYVINKEKIDGGVIGFTTMHNPCK